MTGELALATELYKLITRLITEGLVSKKTKIVPVVRPDGPKDISMTPAQLKQAVEGPAQGLWFTWTDQTHAELLITKGKVQGNLRIWKTRIAFETPLNSFNYQSDSEFDTKLREAKRILKGNGSEVLFTNPGAHSATLTVRKEKRFSEKDAWDFLQAVLLSLQ